MEIRRTCQPRGKAEKVELTQKTVARTEDHLARGGIRIQARYRPELADWSELTDYFKKLSSESDRIRYKELGKKTEGSLRENSETAIQDRDLAGQPVAAHDIWAAVLAA